MPQLNSNVVKECQKSLGHEEWSSSGLSMHPQAVADMGWLRSSSGLDVGIRDCLEFCTVLSGLSFARRWVMVRKTPNELLFPVVAFGMIETLLPRSSSIIIIIVGWLCS